LTSSTRTSSPTVTTCPIRFTDETCNGHVELPAGVPVPTASLVPTQYDNESDGTPVNGIYIEVQDAPDVFVFVEPAAVQPVSVWMIVGS
jgi:hypothetical protein